MLIIIGLLMFVCKFMALLLQYKSSKYKFEYCKRYSEFPTNQFRSSFHNLLIIFSLSLMGFKVICQIEKELLKGLANVQEIFSETISLVTDL